MLDFLFFACLGVFTVLIYLCFFKFSRNGFRINIFSSFIAINFIINIIGLPILYLGLDPYYYSYLNVDNQLIITKLLIINIFMTVLMALICLPLTKLVSSSFWRYSSQKVETSATYFLTFSVFISLLMFVEYVSRVESLAIFDLFYGGVYSAAVSRDQMGNQFAGGIHYFDWFMKDLLTVAIFGWCIGLKRRSINPFTHPIFLIVFLYLSFLLLMGLHKHQFSWFIVGLWICNQYSHEIESAPKLRKVPVKFISALTGTVAVLFFFFVGFDSVADAGASIFSRLFVGSAQTAYHYLDLFPTEISFLGGKSFPNPGGILPHDPIYLPQLVHESVYPMKVGTYLTGSMPAPFWAEAYANFGYVGLVGSIVVISIIIAAFDSFFLQRRHTILTGLFVWLILHFKDLALKSFSAYVFDFQLVVITVCCLLGVSVLRSRMA